MTRETNNLRSSKSFCLPFLNKGILITIRNIHLQKILHNFYTNFLLHFILYGLGHQIRNGI